MRGYRGMSMNGQRMNWGLPQVGRRTYFLCAGLLLVVIAIMPLSFALSPGAAAGWLLLFTARIRDMGRRLIWSGLGLVLVALEMFIKEIGSSVVTYIGRQVVGYFVMAVFAIHLVFAVALGLQRGAPRPSAT